MIINSSMAGVPRTKLRSRVAFVILVGSCNRKKSKNLFRATLKEYTPMKHPHKLIILLCVFLAVQLCIAQSPPRDTVLYNMYGNLRDDNPAYNEKQPLWEPVLGIIEFNVFTNFLDTYVFKNDGTRVGFVSWGRNLKAGFPWGPGWEWDHDRFGGNFFMHPYSGNLFFNSARVNGYNFYESIPYTFVGSYMWKIFGETLKPERNDLIMTTVGGVFLGEISYRVSSYFLDDRTTGVERFFRELFAGVIDPPRAFNRFQRGQFSRATSEEIYQKEPFNMTFSAGAHLVNDGRSFGTGSMSEMLTLHLDYGNPFEQRSRKPFDYFKLRADLSFGVGRKIVDNVIGDGIWFGKNIRSGNLDMLIGGFQHYDYWDNKTFELSSIAFGGGLISKLPVSANSNLYFDAHLGIVPFAGNSTQLGPDTSQFRDYNYGGGAEGNLETTLNLGGWTSVTFRGYYYWIHTYVGNTGENFIGIIKPSVAFKFVDNLSIGFEQLLYYTDRYPRDFPDVHEVRSEQKVFLQLYIDNFKQER